MNILVIAPHPDDEAIGCGGTICLHTQQRNDRVIVVFLSSGEMGIKDLPVNKAQLIREAEAEAASSILGVSELTFLRYPDYYIIDHIEDAAKSLYPILKAEMPEIIYLPHEHEGHPDHRAAYPIVQRAFEKYHKLQLPTLLTYEVWTPLPDYYHVEDITPVMNRKLDAIRCHHSQVSQLAYDRAVMGLNQYRGVIAGSCQYAEIFQNILIKSD